VSRKPLIPYQQLRAVHIVAINACDIHTAGRKLSGPRSNTATYVNNAFNQWLSHLVLSLLKAA
jgi:hypothetical protein